MTGVNACALCGEPMSEVLQVCPDCMRKAGVSETDLEAVVELQDIAAILKITAPTDSNIRVAVQGILNIAERLKKKEGEKWAIDRRL